MSRTRSQPYPYGQQCSAGFCTHPSLVSQAQGRCHGTGGSGDGKGTPGKVGALHESQIHAAGCACSEVSFNHVSYVSVALISMVSRRLLEVLQQYRMMKATQAATQAAAQASQTSATTAPTASTEYGASTAPAVPAQAVASSYTQPSAPIAPAAPTAITIQPPPISAPTQPVAASVASDAAKRQGAGPGTQPPSQVPRTSGTPVQQVGHAPTAIPPHLQPHAAQTAHRTPPRTSQSPHPPPNGAPSAPTPPGPDARPPSAMQRPPSQPVHAAATPRPPSVHPVGAQPVHAQYQGAQQAVAATKVAQNNMFKKQQSQLAATVTNGVPTGTFPQGAQAGAAQGLAPMSYYQYYQYANAAQQRLNPPVQSATPVNRSPMNSSQGSTPQHSSPLAASQRLTTQSPRPSNAQQPQAQVQAQAQAHAHAPVVAAQPQPQPQPQPQVQPGQQATPNNYAYAAMQYAQFRQQTQGYVAQTPLVPHHAANGAQAGSGTNPQAAQRTAQQQYPPQSYLYYHAMQPNYWQMGRGAPVANGQVQIPNISAHTQQVVNTNKPVQGGVQGS